MALKKSVAVEGEAAVVATSPEEKVPVKKAGPKKTAAKKAAPKPDPTQAEPPEVDLAVEHPATRKDLAAAIRDRVFAAGKAVPESIAEIMVVAYEEVIAETLASGRDVSLSGFGKWVVQDIPARERRNPATGQTFMGKASRTAKFKPSGTLKARINQEK